MANTVHLKLLFFISIHSPFSPDTFLLNTCKIVLFCLFFLAVCPNNGGILLDEGQQPKLCTENLECQGSGKGAYYCNSGYCCSESGELYLLVI